ncbi:hypothetical protein Tco_0678022 [Tanacetum coccineum]|uniref:Uncharacterized protein n=1 Tax=Tanacetum coccineum TaxID=301880 RepID=A0ABQ4XER5_9ASTR
MLLLISILSLNMRGVIVLFDVFGLFSTATVPALFAAMARINYFEFNGRRAHGMKGVELNFHVNMPPLLPDVNHTYDDADMPTNMQLTLQRGRFTMTVSVIAFPGFMTSPGGVFPDFGVGLDGLKGGGPGGVLPDFGVGFCGLGGGGLRHDAKPSGHGHAALAVPPLAVHLVAPLQAVLLVLVVVVAMTTSDLKLFVWIEDSADYNICFVVSVDDSDHVTQGATDVLSVQIVCTCSCY